jgi:hypothetical protein
LPPPRIASLISSASRDWFMTITLNHTIVPTRDKNAAARWFAEMFGLSFTGVDGQFRAGED